MSPSADEPFYLTFSSDFQQRVAGINNTLDDPQANIEQLQKDVAGLSKFLSDAIAFIPSYDQKRYESQLKELEQRVEQKRKSSSTGERKRFAFKRKAQSSTPTSGASTPQSSSAPTSAPSPSRLGPTMSNVAGQVLTMTSLPEPRSGALTLSNISDSVIDLTRLGSTEQSLQLSSAHFTSLSSCIVILPPIAGSIMIHSLSKCTIVVSCHQLRIHDSQDVNILLELNSPESVPILEGCTRLHFGPHPSSKDPFPSFTPQDFSNVLASGVKNWDYLPSEKTPDLATAACLPDGPISVEAQAGLRQCLP